MNIMPLTELIISGLNLMLLGMGIVFTFLVTLVFSMLGMSRLAQAVEEQAADREKIMPPTPTIQPSVGTRGDLVAVISAAISRYRTTHS
jgi:oxaloacetate decarboxylase gamma subunit